MKIPEVIWLREFCIYGLVILSRKASPDILNMVLFHHGTIGGGRYP